MVTNCANCVETVTLAPSQHTHMQHKQHYTHHSHRNHRIYRGYQDKLTDRPKTTTQLHTPHKASSKNERNLIILQVNINGIKNKLEKLNLLIHDTHAHIITIQETKVTPKTNTPKLPNFTTVRTDRLHKAGEGCFCCCRPTPPACSCGGVRQPNKLR